MMSDELKACPFCDSEHVELVCSGSQWFGRCNECDATGPVIADGEDGDSQRATEAWNRARRKAPPSWIDPVKEKIAQEFMEAAGLVPQNEKVTGAPTEI